MDFTLALASPTRRLRRRIGTTTGALLGILALGSATLAPSLLPIARAAACDTTPKTLPFSLDFSATTGCVLDKDDQASGFTGVQDNDASKGVPAYQPQLIDLDTAAGTLTLTSTATITGSKVLGSNFRNDNTQVNALEVALDASAVGASTTKVFTITTQLQGPLTNIDAGREQAALYFGPDDDNYVKVGIVGGKPGGTVIEFIDEIDGKIGELQGAQTSVVPITAISDTITTLDLMLVGDQEGAKITAFYAINGGTAIKMPFDVTLASTGNPSKKNQFFNDGTGGGGVLPSKAGILVTNKNRLGPIATTFNSFSIVDAQRPSANAGLDQNVRTGDLVTLNGVGYLPAGAPTGTTIASYGWALSGSSPITYSDGLVLNGSGATRNFTAPSGPGVLTFTLTVTDSNGVASSPDSVRIFVNESPITAVDVSYNNPTTLGQPTAFTATANTGATNVSYSWDFGDGDSDNGQNVSHVYDFPGTYTATVTAFNSISTISETRIVEVVNLKPLANAGATQNVPQGGQVTLNGSASSDPDGHLPLSYFWRQVGGLPVTLSNPAAVSPTFTAPTTPTSLLFSLVVTDSRGLASDPAVTTVNAGDPAVDGVTITTSSPTVLGATTFFSATAEGTGITYSWNFGDGSAPTTGQNVQHVYAAEGDYPVALTVTNGVSTTTRSVFVKVTNTAPTANAGQDTTIRGESVITLTGTGSDPDGHLPLSYSWRQISGSPVAFTASQSGAAISFTAPRTVGLLQFELTVTDVRGKSAVDTVQVTVTPGPTRLRLPIVMNNAGGG